jgi:hypothetical protein
VATTGGPEVSRLEDDALSDLDHRLLPDLPGSSAYHASPLLTLLVVPLASSSASGDDEMPSQNFSSPPAASSFVRQGPVFTDSFSVHPDSQRYYDEATEMDLESDVVDPLDVLDWWVWRKKITRRLLAALDQTLLTAD